MHSFCSDHALSATSSRALQSQFTRTPIRLLALVQLTEQQIWARMQHANGQLQMQRDCAQGELPLFDVELAQLLLLHIREHTGGLCVGPDAAFRSAPVAVSTDSPVKDLLEREADAEPDGSSIGRTASSPSAVDAEMSDAAAESSDLARQPVAWYFRRCPSVVRVRWFCVI